MSDQEEDRPSFSTFWKKSKEALGGRKITFVSANPTAAGYGAGSNDDDEGSPPSAKDKAQVRRAQVRKAQIQHRQRKANYIKQLEMDVGKLRDLIAGAERDTRQLQRENESIRLRLTGSIGVASAGPSPNAAFGFQSLHHQHQQDYELAPTSATTSLFSHDYSMPDMTVSLDFDDILNSPYFQITRTSSPSASSWNSGPSSPQQQAAASMATDPTPTATPVPPPAGPLASPMDPGQSADGVTGLTPEQADQAINFILALEHICWDHFSPTVFSQDPDLDETGHVMMATTLCVRSASETSFTRLRQAARSMKAAGSLWSSRNRQPGSPSPIGAAGPIEWRAHGITLQSLLGLASSINPGDKELTPVQAWFELAAQYNPALLLSPRVLDGLKREFAGVVKCLHFGATIERDAFESVVGRVIGQELNILSGFEPAISQLANA